MIVLKNKMVRFIFKESSLSGGAQAFLCACSS